MYWSAKETSNDISLLRMGQCLDRLHRFNGFAQQPASQLTRQRLHTDVMLSAHIFL